MQIKDLRPATGTGNAFLPQMQAFALQKNARNDVHAVISDLSLVLPILCQCSESPKRFRFTLVAKLQGYAVEGVECLYRANEVYAKTPQAAEKRLDWQHQAITAFRLLGYMAQLAMEQQCTPAQAV